jgi:Skp family chaperone for outer membrane proteins
VRHALALLAAVTVVVALTSGGLRSHADDSTANAAAAETPNAGIQVALIDVGQIFRNHKGFKKKMEEMKKELVEVDGRLKLENAQIQVFQERLKTLDAQSQEHLELEDKITTQKSSQQVRIAREKRRFMRQESAIYAEIYKEVQKAVEEYAREHGIRLVIRYNSQPINESDSNSVMKGVNRNVVFQDGLDITAEIVQRLNASDIEPGEE